MNIIDTNSWNKILDKMIIIGGSARSGTTIMGKLINSLENVEYYFEPPLLIDLLLKVDELKIESMKELLNFYFFDNFLLDCLAGRNINLNKNDDSSIFHTKSVENIRIRQRKTLTRIELEEIVQQSTFSFKLPEIVFFLDQIDNLFPLNSKILMHRNPNDVISSLLKKKWYSDEFLDISHPSQVFAIEIIDNIKVPYWIEDKDKNFWVNASELNRCAYYYIKISQEILNNLNSSIIVDYDVFIKDPSSILNIIVDKLNLCYGEKTNDILNTVKYQAKKRHNHMLNIDNILGCQIEELDEKLKKECIKRKL